MEIISVRRGYLADHSSTSYEFLAVDRNLTEAERAKVAQLSSRVRPTRRRASFIYHWSDLPGGWQPLMNCYDVMYTESYDWWTLAMAFETDAECAAQLKKYEFSGSDDLGVEIIRKRKRVIVAIHCRIDASWHGYDNEWDYWEENSDEDSGEERSDNEMLNLLRQNREHLRQGDCRLLYGVWQKYGDPEDEKQPPAPKKMRTLPKDIKELLDALADA